MYERNESVHPGCELSSGQLVFSCWIVFPRGFFMCWLARTQHAMPIMIENPTWPTRVVESYDMVNTFSIGHLWTHRLGGLFHRRYNTWALSLPPFALHQSYHHYSTWKLWPIKTKDVNLYPIINIHSQFTNYARDIPSLCCCCCTMLWSMNLSIRFVFRLLFYEYCFINSLTVFSLDIFIRCFCVPFSTYNTTTLRHHVTSRHVTSCTVIYNVTSRHVTWHHNHNLNPISNQNKIQIIGELCLRLKNLILVQYRIAGRK